MPASSATEPMALSMTARMADLSTSPARQIPSAAQRYYAQPRIGNLGGSVIPPTHKTKVGLEIGDALAKGRQLPEAVEEKVNEGNGESAPKTPSRKRKRRRPMSISPSRHSPRLVKQRTAALQRMLREHLAGSVPPTTTKRGKMPRRRSVDLISDTLPALSEDPASYNSNSEDCRFHLPSTAEDRLAIRAALTPTLFRLRKKGWDADVVWNPDASYMEAHQRCLQEYYKFELVRKPNLSPFDLPAVLALLPWTGKISGFRSSPNWPEGW
ncbi:hypothetical protein GJ744_000111 [Endocarpon pusillum]|uniref:Uncharacterized protein n=1 Tax=Endocarpon pusillum TaxID=364733 RepID=A0A8H7AWN7_9EURO|nr:hypothetical protein GJ744_000111 [Endocarpon pusillum]